MQITQLTCLLCMVVLIFFPRWCAADAESDALALPGIEASANNTSKTTQMSVEIAIGMNIYDGAKSGRMSGATEMVWTPRLSTQLNGRFSDRLDGALEGFTARDKTATNTLRETYLEYGWSETLSLRIGRENIKQGVGMGYNPTDYFRANAVRSYISLNPNALRTNRSGTFAMSGTRLWDTGAWSFWLAPKLGDGPESSSFSLDAGSTNPEHAVAMSITQQLTSNIKPQVLIYHANNEATAAGLNLNALFFDNTIVYLEASFERRTSLWDTLFTLDTRYQKIARGTMGVTYTSENKITLTAEYDYNGDGLTHDDWNKLRAAGAHAVTRYFVESRNSMNPPSNKNVFLHLMWKDAGIRDFEIAGFARHSIADNSQLYWVEGVYHYRSFDIGARLQAARGERGSVYGSLFSDEWVMAFARAYF